MHRPAFMPAPAFALKLMMGEMAEALVLSGQRAIPDKAKRLGFTFRYHSTMRLAHFSRHLYDDHAKR